MCGISGIFQIKQPTDDLRQKVLRMSQKLRHRGPDWSGIEVLHEKKFSYLFLSL